METESSIALDNLCNEVVQGKDLQDWSQSVYLCELPEGRERGVSVHLRGLPEKRGGDIGYGKINQNMER
jgi:hypothetical protein